MKNREKIMEIVTNEELKNGALVDREIWLRASVVLQFINLREELDLTQVKVAEKMGVSFQQVSKFESLVNSPTLMFLMKYAKALGTSIDVILKDIDQEEIKVL